MVGNLNEKDHFEDLGVDGRIILKRVKEIGREVVDWINLAQDKGEWRALLNTVIAPLCSRNGAIVVSR
jgi:hypothetical protein